MFVGIIKIELRMNTVFSLKDKRKIVSSVKNKLAARFKISVSEVEDQKLYNSSVLGLSFVSLKRNHAVTKGQNIIRFMEDYVSDVFHDYNMIIEEY